MATTNSLRHFECSLSITRHCVVDAYSEAAARDIAAELFSTRMKSYIYIEEKPMPVHGALPDLIEDTE